MTFYKDIDKDEVILNIVANSTQNYWVVDIILQVPLML